MFVIAKDLIERRYGDHLYVFDPSSDRYVRIEQVGIEMWEGIREGSSADQIVAAIVDEYEVEQSTVRTDFNEFIASLSNCGFLAFEKLPDRVLDSRPIGNTKPDELTGTNELIASASSNGNLYSLQISLTNRCNLDCLHCYEDTRPPFSDLPLGQIKTVVDQARSLGCFKYILTGGEPLLHPEIFPILDHLLGKDCLVVLFSNGLLLGDGFIERYRGNPHLRLEISLYGRADIHDRITGRKNSGKRLHEILHRLAKARMRVTIKAMMMEGTIGEKQYIADLCGDLGVEAVFDDRLISSKNPTKNPSTLQVVNSQIDGLPLQIDSCDQVTPDPDTPFCHAGNAFLYIDHLGTIQPCLEFPLVLGNIGSSSLLSTWFGNSLLQRLREFTWQNRERCLYCLLRRECKPCIGRSFKEFGRIDRPAVQDCRMPTTFEEGT